MAKEEDNKEGAGEKTSILRGLKNNQGTIASGAMLATGVGLLFSPAAIVGVGLIAASYYVAKKSNSNSNDNQSKGRVGKAFSSIKNNPRKSAAVVIGTALLFAAPPLGALILATTAITMVADSIGSKNKSQQGQIQGEPMKTKESNTEQIEGLNQELKKQGQKISEQEKKISELANEKASKAKEKLTSASSGSRNAESPSSTPNTTRVSTSKDGPSK